MFYGKSFENRLLGGLAAAVALLTLLAMVVPQASQADTIDFDDLAQPSVFIDTTRLTYEYQAQGVVFQGPGGNDGGAILDISLGTTGYSSPNLLAFNPSAMLADGGIPQPPERIWFEQGASEVSALVGVHPSEVGVEATMTAYDWDSSAVDSASVTLAPAMALLSVSGNIRYVVVDVASPVVWALDDLDFRPGRPCCMTGGPGCNDPAIEAAVCAADPWCCSQYWDFACVAKVTTVAGDNCDCCSDSLDATGCYSPTASNGVADCVCAQDSYCCSNRWDPACVGEVEFFGCGICGCGNGVIDPGEDCDGSNLDGETCQSQGFFAGTLSCNAGSCTFDTSACTNPTPTPTPPPGIVTPTPTPTPPPGVTPTPSPTPPATAPIQGEIKSVKVQLKFNKPSMDKIGVKIKNWSLPAGVVPTDVTVNVGDAEFTGTLDAKGKYKSADGRDALKMKQKNGLWKITVKRKNNSFAADLTDEGLTNADNPKPGVPVTVPLTIEVGGGTYSQDVNLFYKSNLGKKGTAQ